MQIKIFDTTLRDGEQSPGASMTLNEKVKVARQLERMGVDIIEAGFPAASNGDFKAVQKISSEVKEVTIAGLARAKEADIKACFDAIKAAKNNRIHTFIATSPLHREYKLKKSKKEVLELIKNSVGYAKSLTNDVEWSAEDGVRTELDFLMEAVQVAVDAGAGTINIPDTVGYSTPDEIYQLFHHLSSNINGIDKVILSTHCHNDLGLAVANSMAAIKGGARQVECTINGIGERAGNAALEEIVMALRTRADTFPYTTNIDTKQIVPTSRLVSQVSGFVVAPNKAIVGANAFAHESGIHQDGVLKHAQTYEIISPADVGLTKSNLVLGKHSGRHAFETRLKELGYHLDKKLIDETFLQFKELADNKKEVLDEDLIALVDDQSAADANQIKLVSTNFKSDSNDEHSEAAVTLLIDDVPLSTLCQGYGPIDAAFTAVKKLLPFNPHLELYQVHAVTGGTNALGEVTVRLTHGKFRSMGQASDNDVFVASVKAYVNAANKLILQEKKVTDSD